jgi:DNA-binding HxlR family transcriptional regulator
LLIASTNSTSSTHGTKSGVVNPAVALSYRLQSLDVFGDRWTLLVVCLILGKARYKDLVASPGAIPTNILADRLQKLLRHDIVRQVPVSEKARHFGYKLTAKGEALKPLLCM